MEGENNTVAKVDDEEEGQYSNLTAKSPEIVEIGEEISCQDIVGDESVISSDVYVAVGNHDLHVVKWAIDHAISTGGRRRLVLVHVFPHSAFISTPVGKLSRSQLSKDQVQYYIREEMNKRHHKLQKYIKLCNESKVTVDAMLIESNATRKAILELIPIANITNLVMGTKQSPLPRLSKKGLGKGEYVKKYAPEFCGVTVVYDGKKMESRQSQVATHSERHFFECVCFSGKSISN